MFGLAFVCHLVAGWIESRACSRACVGCESLSKLAAVWFWCLCSTVVMCFCNVWMVAALKRLKADGVVRPWKSWQWMVHASLVVLGLFTFLRVIVGVCFSRAFLNVSGSRV